MKETKNTAGNLQVFIYFTTYKRNPQTAAGSIYELHLSFWTFSWIIGSSSHAPLKVNYNLLKQKRSVHATPATFLMLLHFLYFSPFPLDQRDPEV